MSARSYKYKFVIEQSFTLLDHQFFKQFIQDQPKGALRIFKQMSSEHVQRILHNIFPEGKNTLLHMIAESDMGFESVDFFT